MSCSSPTISPAERWPEAEEEDGLVWLCCRHRAVRLFGNHWTVSSIRMLCQLACEHGRVTLEMKMISNTWEETQHWSHRGRKHNEDRQLKCTDWDNTDVRKTKKISILIIYLPLSGHLWLRWERAGCLLIGELAIWSPAFDMLKYPWARHYSSRQGSWHRGSATVLKHSDNC